LGPREEREEEAGKGEEEEREKRCKGEDKEREQRGRGRKAGGMETKGERRGRVGEEVCTRNFQLF